MFAKWVDARMQVPHPHMTVGLRWGGPPPTGHVFLGQHAAAGEEHFVLIFGAADADGLCQINFFVIELVLHLADGGAQTVGVHGVGGAVMSAENHAPVFHSGNAQNGGGNMNNGVDIGKIHIQNGV